MEVISRLKLNCKASIIPEAVDGSKVARVPDVEGCIEDVCFLELLQLGLGVPQLRVQAPTTINQSINT